MNTKIADTFSNVAAILRTEDPNKILLLAQVGLAVRALAGLYAAYPALCEEIDFAGQCISGFRLRLPGAFPDGHGVEAGPLENL